MHRRLALGFFLLGAAACSAAAATSESNNDLTSASAAPTVIVDPSYATTTGLNSQPPSFAFSAAGRAVIGHAASDSLSFDARLADGAADGPTVTIPLVGATTATYLIDDDGAVVAYGSHLVGTAGGATAFTKPFIARIQTGALDVTFGTAGILTLNDDLAALAFDSVAAHPSTAGLAPDYYAVLSTATGSALVHLDAGGKLDATFGGTTDGRVALPAGGTYAVSVDGAGRPTLLDSVHCQAFRFTATGQNDTTFGTTGGITSGMSDVKTCTGFALADGSLIVQIATSSTTLTTAISADGNTSKPITSLPNASAPALVGVAADGKLMALQNGLVRLDADGTVDKSFPVQSLTVTKLGFLADGSMLVASVNPVADGGSDSSWTVEHLFATPRTVPASAKDAGAPDAAPPTTPATTRLPIESNDDTSPETSQGPAPTPITLPPAQDHAGGCSSTPGRAAEGATWILLALAALAARRRR